MIAAIIFSLGILAFYFFSINSGNETAESFENLDYEAKIIADSLLSEGSPNSWAESNVVRIGLLSENKINATKLESFKTLSESDYAKTKSLFNIRGNYYISFSENIIIANESTEFIGQKPLEAQNLLKVTRLSSYNDKPLMIYIHAWD